MTPASVEKNPASTSPFSRIRINTKHPTDRPTPIPVSMDFLARFGFPAPTFCETKEAMDCIRELGTSMAKFTILHATP